MQACHTNGADGSGAAVITAFTLVDMAPAVFIYKVVYLTTLNVGSV
jgi:hypothetical protein